jgi:hypothetical protein
MKINTDKISKWDIATKTKPIKAKPLINLLVDKTVATKFLVDTLEGKEPCRNGAMVCVGESGDIWQQVSKKLLQKYYVTSIDDDGWMICTPKPDNEVECREVAPCFFTFGDENVTDFYIIGQWGETVGDEKNVQRGVVGDFICRNKYDESDVWIVKRKLFLNTYSIKL